MKKEQPKDSKTWCSICILLLLFILICLALIGLIFMWTRNERNRQLWNRWASSLGNKDEYACREPDCAETCTAAPNYKTTLPTSFNISQSRLKLDLLIATTMPSRIEVYSADHSMYMHFDFNPTNQAITLDHSAAVVVTVTNVTCIESNKNISLYMTPISNQNDTLQGYHFDIEPLNQPFKRQNLGELNVTSTDKDRKNSNLTTYKLDVPVGKLKFIAYCIQTPARK